MEEKGNGLTSRGRDGGFHDFHIQSREHEAKVTKMRSENA